MADVITNDVNLLMLRRSIIASAAKPSLPYPYRKVQYIQSDGGQYIDTGIKAGSNAAVIVDYQHMDDTKLVKKVIVGVLGTSNARFSFGTRDTSNALYFGHGTNHTYPGINADTNRHVAYMDLITKTYGFDSTTGSLSSFTMNTSGTLALFAIHNEYNDTYAYFATCRIYDAVLKNNGIDVAHFVPCYNKNTDEIGLYDTVRNQFFGNLGTGAFTKGPNV